MKLYILPKWEDFFYDISLCIYIYNMGATSG